MQRERMGDTLEAIGDRLSPERMVERRKAAVGQTFRNVKESVMGSPGYQEPATDRLRTQAGDVRDAATSAVQNASEHVQQAPQALADQARGNPVAAGIIAFGVGVLLATLLPSSRTEQRRGRGGKASAPASRATAEAGRPRRGVRGHRTMRGGRRRGEVE